MHSKPKGVWFEVDFESTVRGEGIWFLTWEKRPVNMMIGGK
jgi:hypothetical protein